MKPYEDQDPWELLGIVEGASTQEIQLAYEKLSAVLSPGALALYSVADHEEQRRLARALHVAYLRLLHAANVEVPVASTLPPTEVADPVAARGDALPPSTVADTSAHLAPPAPVIEPTTEITGLLLRQLRESRRLSVEQVAQRTRIRPVHIENIEVEDFNALPERVFTRGFVMTYARELGVDPDRAWSCIEARFVRVRPPQELRFPT